MDGSWSDPLSNNEAIVGFFTHLAGDHVIFSSVSLSKRVSFHYLGCVIPIMQRGNTVSFSKYELPTHIFSSFNRTVGSYIRNGMLFHLLFVSPPLSYHFNTPIPIQLPRCQHSSCNGHEVLSVHFSYINDQQTNHLYAAESFLSSQ